MSNQDRWKPQVYLIADEKAAFRYWSLVAHQDGPRVRYSRVGQFKDLTTAAINARDLSRMYNSNQMTPKQEGTTFAPSKLPRGAFVEEQTMTDLYAAQDKRITQFLSVLDDIANGGRKPK